jgi:hypothetical protein
MIESKSIRAAIERLESLHMPGFAAPRVEPAVLDAVHGALADLLGQLVSFVEASVGKGREMEEAARFGEIERMNLEGLARAAESRQRAAEARMEGLERDLAGAEEALLSARSAGQQESEELGRARRETERLEAELALSKGRQERAEMERGDLARVLERKQGEIDALNGIAGCVLCGMRC